MENDKSSCELHGHLYQLIHDQEGVKERTIFCQKCGTVKTFRLPLIDQQP